ncbi:MAG: TlpA family protein disulfide reductase [Acidimicrobiales bacterium]
MTRLATRKPSIQTARQRRPRRTAVPVAVGVLLGVVVVALVASLLAGSGDDPATTSTSGSEDTTATGAQTDAALPPLADAGDDPAIGMALPVLTGTDVTGESMTIASDGRPKLVVFLAHWCPHCQREVPVVQDWVDRGGLPDGVDLVAVATAIDQRRPNYPADEWLDREGWTAPVLYDHGDSAGEAAGLSAFPYFVATDGDGTVVARATGELTESQLGTLAVQAEATG